MKMPTFTSDEIIDDEAKEHRQTTWQDAIKIFKKSALAVILEDRTAALEIYCRKNSTIEEELRIKLCTLSGGTSTFNEHYLLRGINEAINAFRDRIQSFTNSQELKAESIRLKKLETEKKKEEAKAEALNDPNITLKTQIKKILEDYNKSKNAKKSIKKSKQKSKKAKAKPKPKPSKKKQPPVPFKKTGDQQKQTCNHCKQKFKDKKTLLGHLKSKHLDQHPNLNTTKPSRSKTGTKKKEKKRKKSTKKQ